MPPRKDTTRQPVSNDKEVEMSEAESSDWEIDGADEEQLQQQNAAAPKRKPAPVLVKDPEEEELERLVLGDRAGFRAQLFLSDTVEDAGQSLNDLSLAVAGAGATEGEDEGDNEFEDADDAHMFLYDEAADPNTALALGATIAGAKGAATKDTGVGAGFAPAWEDSDDERLAVSLAGQGRLRKLRRAEGEDIVSGAEYAVRLRQQYLRLHPQPAWATEALKARLKLQQRLEGGGAVKKRRRKSRRRSSATSDDLLGSDVSGSDVSGSDDDSDASGDDDLESEGALPLDKFFRSASALAAASQLQRSNSRKKRRLRPEVIDIQKTRDIPTSHTGPVGSLEFHPRYAVLLSSSTSSVLHLNQIAPAAHPTPNPLLTSVRVRQTPVRRSAFLGGGVDSSEGRVGDQIVFAGRRRFFHTWDLATGKVQKVSKVQGHSLEHRTMERFRPSPTGAHLALIASDRKGGGMLNILDVNTMQWVAQARLDSRGGIADFQWWRDGSGITILGRDGRVGEWRLETRRFVGTWRDEGSTGGTVLGLGGSHGPESLGGDRWVVIGSTSGVTNLYDRATLVEAAPADGRVEEVSVKALPTPARVFEQLTTPVTAVAFTPDGQLLAFASQHKRDALRLAHLPSCTVYRNWPTEQTPLGRITAVAFSRDSDLLAVGNDVGKTRLWEIRS